MSGFPTYCLVFLFCIFSFPAVSQDSDTTKEKLDLFPKSHGDKNWRFLIGLDARRSFYRDAPVKINGLKFGLEYKGVHRFGNCFYWLQKDVVFKNSTVDKEDAALNPEVRFNLGYVSFFYERLFLKTRWWEITSPSHIGAGKIIGTYKDTSGTFKPLLEKPFSALTKAGQVRFYPFKWFSIKFLLGFRITFNTDQEVKDAFNRPFYGFGFSIHLMELYQSIFNKKPFEKSS